MTIRGLRAGHRVQLWYAKRQLFPYHGRCGVVRVIHGSPLNVLVQLDGGPSVVVLWGNLRQPPAPAQGSLGI